MHPREFIAKHIKATLEKEEFPPPCGLVGGERSHHLLRPDAQLRQGEGVR